MNFTRLYNRACCVVQWSIGFSKGNIEQIIRNKKGSLSFKWIPLRDGVQSIADPFLLQSPSGDLNLLYESFSETDVSKYGKIVLAALDKTLNIISESVVLDTRRHSSYPFVFAENGIKYIIPETSSHGKVLMYEYDFENNCLTGEKVLIDSKPLLDSTIFKHNGKYWLFATLAVNEYDYCQLFIYYSDSLSGPYFAHANNPVKNNKDGSRPAGNIIKVDGELYRPAQNCSQHYGASISINKITKLSENEFSEEFYFKISPDKNSEFNAGIHTINVVDDIIVVDGIKMTFKPFKKWKLFIEKKLKIGNHRQATVHLNAL